MFVHLFLTIFFPPHLGSNMLFFFVYALLLMFLAIFIDWILRLALLWIVLTMFVTMIFIPFSFANSLLTQVRSVTDIHSIGTIDLISRKLFSILDQQDETTLRERRLQPIGQFEE